MDPIDRFLTERFIQNPKLADSLIDLHRRYASWGLKDTKFDQEFTDGDDGHFYSYLWEMLLASHFKSIGLDISSDDAGPDFKIKHSGKTVWVEAICPAPAGLPEDWLDALKPGEIRVRSLPHEQILLRWTSALKEKKEKLTGRPSRTGGEHKLGYLEKGIVGRYDPYVIAIGACRLGRCDLDLHVGISQLPYAVETVFPVGPLEVVIDRETMKATDTRHGRRLFVHNRSGAEVPTDSFLNPDYSSVSAILGSPAGLNAACGIGSPIAVVHNPFADNPLPVGVLGADEEYVAEDKGEHLELRDISKAAP